MAHSPHRRWKGCALCKPRKHKGCGDAARTPFRELRKIGKKRRYSRHQVD